MKSLLFVTLIGLCVVSGVVATNDGSQQENVDQNWQRRYEAIFKDGSETSDAKNLIDTLSELYSEYRSTSKSNELEPLYRNLVDLYDLSEYANKCDEKELNNFDVGLKKFSNGFSEVIPEYINYQRSKFWELCKGKFLNAASGRIYGPGFEFDDKDQAFAMVDFITDCKQQKDEPWLIIDMNSIELVLSDYVRYKLGDKAYNKDEIKRLFKTTINPTCKTVVYRFRGNDQMTEMLKGHEDLRSDLDEDSLKWLVAIKLCKIEVKQAKFLEKKVLSILSEEQKHTKNSPLKKFSTRVKGFKAERL